MSLADSLGLSADVVTLQESVFLLMDREAFRATAEEVPEGGRNLTRVLCRRLRLGYFRRHGAISVDPHRRITVHDEEAISRRVR